MRRRPADRVGSHAALIACTLLLGACLDNTLGDDPVGARKVFIAQQRDFANYTQWMPFHNDVVEDHGGVVGTTDMYLNQLPTEGSSTFAVGTMIVKVMHAVDSDMTTVHAMTKRGNGFNPNGAQGWEYFELLLDKDGTPVILWRGEDAPTGEQYQLLIGTSTMTTTETSCNSCHANGNDGMLGDDIAGLLKASP
jgi:hypothetical protein